MEVLPPRLVFEATRPAPIDPRPIQPRIPSLALGRRDFVSFRKNRLQLRPDQGTEKTTEKPGEGDHGMTRPEDMEKRIAGLELALSEFKRSFMGLAALTEARTHARFLELEAEVEALRAAIGAFAYAFVAAPRNEDAAIAALEFEAGLLEESARFWSKEPEAERLAARLDGYARLLRGLDFNAAPPAEAPRPPGPPAEAPDARGGARRPAPHASGVVVPFPRRRRESPESDARNPTGSRAPRSADPAAPLGSPGGEDDGDAR